MEVEFASPSGCCMLVRVRFRGASSKAEGSGTNVLGVSGTANSILKDERTQIAQSRYCL